MALGFLLGLFLGGGAIAFKRLLLCCFSIVLDQNLGWGSGVRQGCPWPAVGESQNCLKSSKFINAPNLPISSDSEQFHSKQQHPMYINGALTSRE